MNVRQKRDERNWISHAGFDLIVKFNVRDSKNSFDLVFVKVNKEESAQSGP